MNIRRGPRAENLIYGLLVMVLLLLMAGVDVLVFPDAIVGSAARSTDSAQARSAPPGTSEGAAAPIMTVSARKAPN